MHSNFSKNNLRCWDVRRIRWKAEEGEALKNWRNDDEGEKTNSHSATDTDQPHEVSQTNGAENRRIMSLLSLH